MFEWDRHNLRKIRAHRISREEVEQVLTDDPVLIIAMDIEGEARFVYYGETGAGRPVGAVLAERGDSLRVVTAYDLDAEQRRDYLRMRIQGA